ncbi:response regulator transcription factor [Streptomyces cavernae]|uniref:response regulator transcription factor n=1 Tax=Streptomyces cavernae TaxID=2259034 RepID=UPI001EE41F26|nr:LuxR C-terminal-related transcriptional regulator [Streptomyces cavernae]
MFNTARRDSEAAVRAAVGRREFDRAYRRGGRFGLAEIVSYAIQETPPTPSGSPSRTRTTPLTPRETEVARLVADGLGNQQIADRLVIARRTAEGHVERILRKLGFTKRSQIAAWVSGSGRA